MAFPDLTALRLLVGQWCQDTGTNAGLDATTRTDLLNEAMCQFMLEVKPRIKRIAATTNGWSSASGTNLSLLSSNLNMLDVLRVFREASNSAIEVGPQLERMSVSQILGLQISDSTAGTVTRYALQREDGDITVANVGKWRLYMHPIVSGTGTHFSCQALLHPTLLSATTDVPDLVPAECFVIARVAAGRGAALLGRSQDFVEAIWRGLPEQYKGSFQRESQSVFKLEKRTGLPT